MAGQERPEVLDPEVALEHRLAEVAERRGDRDEDAEQSRRPRRSRPTGERIAPTKPPTHDRRRPCRPTRPSTVLFGEIVGRERRPAELRADEEADDVVGDRRRARRRGSSPTPSGSPSSRPANPPSPPTYTNPSTRDRDVRPAGGRATTSNRYQSKLKIDDEHGDERERGLAVVVRERHDRDAAEERERRSPGGSPRGGTPRRARAPRRRRSTVASTSVAWRPATKQTSATAPTHEPGDDRGSGRSAALSRRCRSGSRSWARGAPFEVAARRHRLDRARRPRPRRPPRLGAPRRPRRAPADAARAERGDLVVLAGGRRRRARRGGRFVVARARPRRSRRRPSRRRRCGTAGVLPDSGRPRRRGPRRRSRSSSAKIAGTSPVGGSVQCGSGGDPLGSAAGSLRRVARGRRRPRRRSSPPASGSGNRPGGGLADRVGRQDADAAPATVSSRRPRAAPSRASPASGSSSTSSSSRQSDTGSSRRQWPSPTAEARPAPTADSETGPGPTSPRIAEIAQPAADGPASSAGQGLLGAEDPDASAADVRPRQRCVAVRREHGRRPPSRQRSGGPVRLRPRAAPAPCGRASRRSRRSTSCVSLLEVLLDPVELVAGDLAVLLERLELLAGVAADVAHRDPALLGPVLHDLHQLLAPLLGELGERRAG